uniref:Astacin n=1 Tax=Magallana gigas TaxID=29159 RepID=K1R8H4_MAGGI
MFVYSTWTSGYDTTEVYICVVFVYLCNGQLDRKQPPKDLTMDQIMSRMLGGYDAIANRLTLPGGLVLKELDMYLTETQVNALNAKTKRKRRKAISNENGYWRSGVMPYTFSPGRYDSADQYFVKVAMRELEKYTCLRFIPRTNEQDYVDFIDAQGCWSQLGRQGGRQELSLDRNGCRFAFSRDGSSPTISAQPAYKDREEEIGRVYQKELSFGDVKVLNAMYKCSIHCPNTICNNGGYLDQYCECICPDGSSDCQQGKTRQNPGCTNVANDWKCNIWAKQGECRRRPSWMNENCARACGVCGNEQNIRQDQENKCENFYDDTTCDKWKENGDCVVAEDWMRQNCKKTCKYCDPNNPRPSTNCVNAHSNDAKCREWALDGECAINPAWMTVNCASDCHTCKNNESLPDGGMKTTRGVVVTRPPVVTTPPPTTPTPNNCEDRYPTANCRDFQTKWNFCSIHKMWMEANCMKTCGLCGGGEREKEIDDCKDDNKQCPVWARGNQCVINPGYMLKYCMKSCRVCTSALMNPKQRHIQLLCIVFHGQ